MEVEKEHLTDSEASLIDSIDELLAASKTPARQRTRDASEVVLQVCSYAIDHGIPSSQLDQLIEVLTKRNELAQSNTARLIETLYPADHVSTSSVLAVVSCLGYGKWKPTPPSQALLVRWLCNVYSVIEEPMILSRLYGTLFGLLDMITLRAALCHLLTLITRRRHVRPFRIQQLLELGRIAGNEAGLLALLRVYKDYYPDIILGPISNSRSVEFLKADSAWRARLAEIQNAKRHPDQTSILRVNGHGGKGSKRNVVPRLHTLRAQESSTTLEEINNVNELVQKLDKIDPPSQIVAVLGDPLMQRYMLLKPSKDNSHRLELWLAQCLDEIIESTRRGTASPEFTSEILTALLTHVRLSKSMPFIATQFLQTFMKSWDGISNSKTVLALLTCLPQSAFSDLHDRYLQYAEASLGMNNTHARELLVGLYNSLLRQYSHMASPASLGNTAPVKDISDHAAILHLSTLASLPESVSVTSSILHFYEMLSEIAKSSIGSAMGSAAVVLPPSKVVYLAAFSSQLDNLSRICSILAAYKSAFEAGIKATVRWPSNFTARFNGYLMDICNLLWRSRALTTADANSLGCLCPEPVAASLRPYLSLVDREYSIASLFGLSHNHLICGFSLKVLQELEEEAAKRSSTDLVRHVGPASQRTLTALEKEGGVKVSWKQYRVEVLERLELHGISGIKELMFVTMKDLMTTSA